VPGFFKFIASNINNVIMRNCMTLPRCTELRVNVEYYDLI